MSLTDKDMAVIFKKDAGDYMIAAENLRTDENSIWLVGPTTRKTMSRPCRVEPPTKIGRP
jgi:hypothetical protein